MTRIVFRIARNERGNAFVELGFLLPIFSALLVGMVDVSRAYSEKLRLTQAVQRSIEWAQVREFSATDVNTLKSNAAAHAGVTTSAVTVDYWLECNSARQASYDGTCTQDQTMGRFVNVQISKAFTPTFTSSHLPGVNSSGHMTLSSSAGVRVQ